MWLAVGKANETDGLLQLRIQCGEQKLYIDGLVQDWSNSNASA